MPSFPGPSLLSPAPPAATGVSLGLHLAPSPYRSRTTLITEFPQTLESFQAPPCTRVHRLASPRSLRLLTAWPQPSCVCLDTQAPDRNIPLPPHPRHGRVITVWSSQERQLGGRARGRFPLHPHPTLQGRSLAAWGRRKAFPLTPGSRAGQVDGRQDFRDALPSAIPPDRCAGSCPSSRLLRDLPKSSGEPAREPFPPAPPTWPNTAEDRQIKYFSTAWRESAALQPEMGLHVTSSPSPSIQPHFQLCSYGVHSWAPVSFGQDSMQLLITATSFLQSEPQGRAGLGWAGR